jgi:hypothetical protein
MSSDQAGLRRSHARIAFPVRCVESRDDRANTSRSRWTSPQIVASNQWPLAQEEEASDDIILTSTLCREAWDTEWSEIASPVDIVWTLNAASLLSVNIDGGIEVAVDVAPELGLTPIGDVPKSDDQKRRGFILLLRLAGVFARRIVHDGDAGFDATDAQRNGLLCVAHAYSNFDTAQHRLLTDVLQSPGVDAGNIFGQFLGILGDNERRLEWDESESEWHERWITWLIGQARVDLPYDRETVSEILLDPTLDPDDARLALYQTVREYNIETEGDNAARIGASVAWAEQELIFGRMSRAFHNQALLFANARYVTITEQVTEAASVVVNDAAAWVRLRPAANRLELMMQPGRESALTEMAGALDHLEEEALRYQRELVQNLLAERRAQVEKSKPDPETDIRATECMKEVLREGEAILQSTGELRRAMLNAPRRPAAYLIMSQRPSPTGAHLLAKINEGEEPFLGKAADLRQLVPQAGDRVYASPDYTWLEHANHWIEAIPLFIKERIRVLDGVETAETVIDQEGMEESFRESMSDPWARNLRRTELSGWCAIARVLVYEVSAELADLSVAADMSRAWRVRTEDRGQDVALLAALVTLAAQDMAGEIGLRVEQDSGDRVDVTRDLLLNTESREIAIWSPVLKAAGNGSDWVAATRTVVEKADDDTRQSVDELHAELLKLADLPRRELPALHVLTTQSANMTDGYVRSWIEESIALYNVVKAHKLDGAVQECIAVFHQEIETLGEALIGELGLNVEVDTIMATEGVTRSTAVRRIISASRTVQKQVALLAVLREQTEHSKSDPNNVDPPIIAKLISTDRQRLENAALRDVVSRNERDIAAAVTALRAGNPGAGETDLQRQVVNQNSDYRDDLDTFVRFSAREAVLTAWDNEHTDRQLKQQWETWLRRHQRLALTTARKQVVTEHGLNHLTLDPKYFCQAVGGNKRFHLLYTPSRVDLGPKERESVETWSQWVGGLDRHAARVGRRVYGLINKNVKRFDSLAEPEVLKTGENASMASHFAYSNAMALMVNASGRGDFEELGDQMSLREDRKIHPAGEGYGGYCVPKDGLFLEFVLTLTEQVKLRQLGVDDRYHSVVTKLASHVLARRDEFETELAWEHWAEELLADEKALADIFQLRDGENGTQIPVFQITRLAAVLDELGQPPLTEHTHVVRALAARWGVHTMIAGAEHVNRFMSFYKAWLTYDGLRHARSDGDHDAGLRAPEPEDAVIVLSAEYKPDTQDGRFAVGMRKYEIYTGTDEHLRYSLGHEAGVLASLMIDGWAETSASRSADDPDLARIARQWGLELSDTSARERLEAVFPGYASPGELRLVSPMGLSTQDVLRYTSDTRIENTADAVRSDMNAAGLSDEDIDTNIQAFGPHTSRWARVRDTELATTLGDSVRGGIHALTLSVLGPDRSYDHALQGADVFDVGIAHKQVLALLDEPARLVDLMLYGRPNSALLIVDGGSGARRRAMSRLGVQRWFAATESRGRTGWYRSIGLGDDTVESWREQMRRNRSRAERLRNCWINTDAEAARAAFNEAVEVLRDDQEALLALDEEERLVRFRRDSERDHLVTELLAEVARMESPEQLSFAHWLAIGGLFILEGLPESEINEARVAFEESTRNMFGSEPSMRYSDRILDIARPGRRAEIVGFRQEGGVESSNKATEEVTSIALDTRQELAKRAQRMIRLRARLDAFETTYSAARRETWTLHRLGVAVREELALPEDFDSDKSFGRVLAFTRLYGELLIEELYTKEPAEAALLEESLRLMLNGRELDPVLVRMVCGGYEDIGAVGRIAQQVVEIAENEDWSSEDLAVKLDEVATFAEFIDIVQALDATLEARGRTPDDVDAQELWRSLATFFAETINDHFYEYRPWAYSRGVGFEAYTGDALYELADRHYRWLYRYLRNLIVTRTETRYLSSPQQDLLIGRISEEKVVVAIGADGDSDIERRWRACNQLREIAFIRNDGFPIPPVFGEFDPALIDADNRVNMLAMYPVGRTHVSRLLEEGPTLAHELMERGQSEANVLLSRLPVIVDNRLVVNDGHFYIDSETYIRALVTHWGLNESGAAALAKRDAGPKGVRIAARFTRPVTVAVTFPMHGNPIYTSGTTEQMGLPYGVQSRFHTWTTYDKAKYPEIFRDSPVMIPDEIDWLAQWTVEIDDESQALKQIREGRPNTDFAGLEEFACQHRIVMIKDAAESGGRGAKAFELRTAGGEPDEVALADAADFVYQISLNHNIAIQEVVISSPELWASEDFLQRFADRQIIEWRRPIVRDRQPQTPLFGSFRIILSTNRPSDPDRRQHWHVSHPITLNSTQLITNVGRGGTLEVLGESDIHEEHRGAIMHALEEAGRDTMEAMVAFEQRSAQQYEEEVGEAVGQDLTGVSYGIPRYLMLDFLVRPVFDRPGDLIDIVPVVDVDGKRSGSRFVLNDGTDSFDGRIVDWDMILIEPNIGIGLWDRVALREIEHERALANGDPEQMNWDNVGANARVVLRDLAQAGAEYLVALRETT